MNILSRRKKHLGNADKYFYEKPLHITKGEDVWLIDDKGKKFLDVYNLSLIHISEPTRRVVSRMPSSA